MPNAIVMKIFFLRPKKDAGFQSRFCSPLFLIRKVSLSSLSYSDSVYSSFSSDRPQKCRDADSSHYRPTSVEILTHSFL